MTFCDNCGLVLVGSMDEPACGIRSTYNLAVEARVCSSCFIELVGLAPSSKDFRFDSASITAAEVRCIKLGFFERKGLQ